MEKSDESKAGMVPMHSSPVHMTRQVVQSYPVPPILLVRDTIDDTLIGVYSLLTTCDMQMVKTTT